MVMTAMRTSSGTSPSRIQKWCFLSLSLFMGSAPCGGVRSGSGPRPVPRPGGESARYLASGLTVGSGSFQTNMTTNSVRRRTSDLSPSLVGTGAVVVPPGEGVGVNGAAPGPGPRTPPPRPVRGLPPAPPPPVPPSGTQAGASPAAPAPAAPGAAAAPATPGPAPRLGSPG